MFVSKGFAAFSDRSKSDTRVKESFWSFCVSLFEPLHVLCKVCGHKEPRNTLALHLAYSTYKDGAYDAPSTSKSSDINALAIFNKLRILWGIISRETTAARQTLFNQKDWCNLWDWGQDPIDYPSNRGIERALNWKLFADLHITDQTMQAQPSIIWKGCRIQEGLQDFIANHATKKPRKLTSI